MNRARQWLVWVAIGLAAPAACSGTSHPDATRGPGFAAEGNEDERAVYLYRFELGRDTPGVVIEFHPRTPDVSIEVTRPEHLTGQLRVCPVDPGFVEGARERTRQSCEKLDIGGPMTIRLAQADGQTHVAIEIAAIGSDIRVDEAIVTYEPADAFLAVNF